MKKKCCIIYFFLLALSGLSPEKFYAQKNPVPLACNCILNATVTATVTCNGGSNGAASASGASIGMDCDPVTFQTFQWYNSGGAMAGQTNATISAVPAGTYTVEWSNDNCFGITDVITITEPAQPLNATTSSTNEICNQNNGTVDVTSVTGGTSPYSYSWNTGHTTSGVGNRNSGTYTCTVTDANGCTKVVTATVSNTNNYPSVSIQSSTSITCYGANNGSATATASGGGGPPYTYSWAPSGGNNATASNLSPGTYTVTCTSSNTCTDQTTVTISQPASQLYISSFSTVPVSCNGGSDGSASVTGVTGGTGSYTYAWAPSGGNNATASNLTAGTYTVTVTDSNGCTYATSVTINQFSALSASVSSTQAVSCWGGSDGSATVTASGGNGSYTYLWSSGDVLATATGLIYGTYNVTIWDVNGCSFTVNNIIISQPAALNVTTSSTSANCGTPSGSASANVSGGTGSYTYQWSPSGGNAPTANNLLAGNYTVTVWDNNGCTAYDFVTVGTSGGISATASATQSVSCNGGSNGAASVTPTSGQAPYTYSWSPSGGSGSAASNLSAGNYVVTVTDANSCVTTKSVTVTQPAALTSAPTSTSANCLNANGSASANAGGGVGGFSYVWNPSGQTTPTATNLSAGNYTVTITDANLCIKTATVTVGTASPPGVTCTPTNVTCFNANNGSAFASPSGGLGPFTYLWNPSGQTAQTATGLSPGNYTVTVTDANFCTAVSTANISQPAVLTASVTVTNASCGGNNGSASASPSGGTSPYTYSWSPSGGTNQTAGNIPAGNYIVNVTDSKGCSTSAAVNITGTPAATASAVSTASVTCHGGNDGAASATAGGTAPYTYAWSPSGGTSSSAVNLTGGNYTVTVTDANSCTAVTIVTIAEPAAITATTNFSQATCGMSDGSATVSGSGGTGALAYSWSTSPVQTTATATGLYAGSYSVTVTDQNNCTQVFSLIVTNANAPSVSISSSSDASCFGVSDGYAVLNVSGGNPPYTYLWSPSGGTNIAASNLSAGIYTVIVTDTLTCLSSLTVTINEPLQVLPNITNNSLSVCLGFSTSIEANASGGTGPYAYSWMPSSDLDDPTLANPVASPTVTTIYTVTITDAKNCSGVGTVTVTVNNLPNINAGPDVTICNSSSTTLNASGGISYQWTPSFGLNNNSISNPVASPTSSSIYIVSGTDMNGCTNTDSLAVQVVPTPSVVIVAFSTTVCSGSTVSLNASSNASVYLWNTGQTTSSVSVVPNITTVYSVTVSSGNCSASASVTVTAIPTPTATISGDDTLCVGDSQVLTATSGNNLYLWSTGATSSSINISPTSNSTYSVTVTSATDNSCFDAATFSVSVVPLPQITASATYSTICIGSSTDTLSATGGIAYVWAPGGETTSAIVVSPDIPTTYTVTVTNSFGCSGSSTILINVTNGFAPPALNPTSSTVCFGDPLPTFTATPNPSNNGIEWTDPGNTFTASGDTFTPPQNLIPGSYTFWCMQGTGTSCLSNPTALNITILPLPNVNAGSDITLCPGYSTQLNASGGISYLWSPSTDLNNSAVANPSAEPQLTTTYEVQVTGANSCKNKDSVTVYVVLNDTCTVIIYNLISPNGDGDNDMWWIDGIKFFPDNKVSIFNRWGSKVWEGNGYDNEKIVWRGDNQNGDKLPVSTYYYIIDFGDKSLSGFVELIH